MSEVSPIFFLALELLLLTATFLAFLTRWYLSASSLSDPAGPLGIPRCFLHRGQREGKGLSYRRKNALCLSTDKDTGHIWLGPILFKLLLSVPSYRRTRLPTNQSKTSTLSKSASLFSMTIMEPEVIWVEREVYSELQRYTGTFSFVQYCSQQRRI